MTDYDEDFEQVDAGASETTPATAGDLKKGTLFVMNGNRPCKVVDYSTAKTGKHGHAKASITGIDIFTGKKYEDSLPCSHNVEIPNVVRKAWTIMTLDDDYVTLFDEETGETKADLKLPDDTEDDKAVSKIIRDGVDAGKSLVVTVLTSMGIEKITDPKESQA